MGVSSVDAPTTGRLIDESLFVEVDGGLRLAGSVCDDCATVTFPAQGSCPRCTGQHVRREALASTGTLWAFTMQRFPPKPPYLGADGPFEPYCVGYVDVGGVLVESRLSGVDIADLEVGMPMRLALEPVPGSSDEPIWTFAFGHSDRRSPREEDVA
jgi:uncharacterized protein